MSDQIPYGYCQCGCGKETNSAMTSDPSRGVLKGDRRAYLRGHHNPYQHRPVRSITDNRDGTATVPLTKGYSALIDIEDVKAVAGFNWSVVESRNTAYASRAGKRGVEPSHILLHRVIANAPDGMEVDHIDRNGLNNTRANIRVCTAQQNLLNKSIYRNSPTGFRGVYPVPSGRYIARIRVDGRWLTLGTFDTAEEAAVVRDQAALIHYGDFAQLNILERKAS